MLFKLRKDNIFSDLKRNNYHIRWLKRVFSEEFSSSLVNQPSTNPLSFHLRFISIQILQWHFEKISKLLSKIIDRTASQVNLKKFV